MTSTQPDETYTKDDAEDLLALHFTGVKPQRVQREEGMPRAKRNPAHLGNEIVEKVDIERAWNRTWNLLEFPMGLYWRYGFDMEVDKVASLCGREYGEASRQLYADLDRIHAALNGWPQPDTPRVD